MTRYHILSVLAAWATTTSCGDLTDVNTNPNGPVDVPPPSILPGALQSVLTDNVFSTGLNVRYGGLWVQHFSEIQYRDEDKYIVRSGTSGGWPMYNGALADFQRMIDKGVEAGAPNWEAVGRIMKSYTVSVMTEAMGDLPYTEALQGNAVLQPAYDTQQSIYTALFDDLTTASNQITLDPTEEGFPSGDLVYDGDMARWRRLANSLRLRLAMHIQRADPTKAAAEAAAAVTAGVFTSSADNAGLSYLSSGPNQNPIYRNRYVDGRDDYGMSRTLVDSMTSWNDPRLPVYAQPNKYGAFRGLQNGLNDGEGPPLDSISRYGAYWREEAAADMYFITYAEVLLLQAEAVERGWIGGDAAALYAAGIRASMEQHGISDVAITNYLAQLRAQYDAAPNTQASRLQQIAYQLWIGLYMNGMEAWTQWRRTQVPSLMPGPRAVRNAGVLNGVPERMPYDDQENVLNQANVEAAVTAQGFAASNDLWKPLWFTGRQ